MKKAITFCPWALSAALLTLLVSSSQAAPNTQAGNDATIAAIKASGQPTTFAALNAWYPAVPADQNAASVYAQAFALLPEKSSDTLPPLVQSQKTLDYLHQAAARVQCRYPVDFNLGFRVLLPHLAKFKLSAELLQQEAVLNATKGRMDLSEQSVLAGLGLVRSLEHEPTILSQFIRSRVIELTITGLEQSLWHKAYSDEQLSQLQAAFSTAETNDAPAYQRALVGERCMGLAVFKSPRDFFALVGGDYSDSGTMTDPEFDQALTLYLKGGTNILDLEFYLKQMGEMIALSVSPFPARLDKGMDLGALVVYSKLQGFLISPSLLPSVARVPEKSAIGVAELRVAQVILATERYRLAHDNSLPDSLGNLVPQYLPAVPVDPFDGAPLRFKKIPKRGYMIYSIGADRQDDGGIHKPLKPTAGMRYDLAVTVLR